MVNVCKVTVTVLKVTVMVLKVTACGWALHHKNLFYRHHHLLAVVMDIVEVSKPRT